MADWDDARFVLALARSGSIRKAAQSLEVNHTTVSRRISAIERRLSARLFEQTPAGYVLTASGKIICKAAEGAEDLLLNSERRIEGADSELSGNVHIHYPDIFDQWLCERLAPFTRQHPKLNLHLTSSVVMADLARREADVAIRVSQTPPEDMVGRKVCSLPAAIYAGVDFNIDTGKKLSEYPWVLWASMYKISPVEIAAAKHCDKNTQTLRITTYHSLTNLVRNGAGIGYLSPWFADNDPTLKRVETIQEDVSMDIWVLIHPDLRGVKRIKAITDMLKEMFEEMEC